ncbi:epi-neemfruitin B 7-O-acetyltransferse L7AT-like [Apium graveolens]|uniref:epi-neemfruitin B 7-O-acetyltransferse L7AT-like n=1 Tax=Apium graveolens TaxID=4045 RepID=UPI003D7B3B1F
MMKVEIISEENIKPSSATPQHLKIFKLCLLDHLIPAPFVPMVLYFPINDNGATKHVHVQERLVLLKQSLSQTLTRFYPLAGIIKDDLCIDCNDQGAYFAVAKVSYSLYQFLEHPNLQLISSFLPCELGFTGSSSGVQATHIQVNTFECGGIAIALCISHKVLDGASLYTFLKAWSGIACESEKVVNPDFVGSLLFPTDELWLKDASMVMWGSLFKKGKCTTRRFVFDTSAIATLKTMTSGKIAVQHPTRVEAVSGFLWKCAMAASEKRFGARRSSLLTHLVNLRKKFTPDLSDESIGNIIWIASAKCKAKNDELGYWGLVDQVRKGVSEINVEFVKSMMGDQGAAVMGKSMNDIGNFGSSEEGDHYGCTSWCNFGYYELDFGFGKPVWVSNVGLEGDVLMNFIILIDTRCGRGIEAWVTLDEPEMNLLVHDPDLLALASLDPSPVKF